MEGDRKRFSKGWFTGLVLGSVTAVGAVAYAVTIPHTFRDGQTASATEVNANFEALRNAIDGCTAEMARVGSTCVDTTAQVITDTAGCPTSGQGCSAVVTGTSAAVPYSWGQALAACTNAGKRLATSREIIAGFNAGALSIAPDALVIVDATAATPLGQPYAATHLKLGANGFELLGTQQTPYTQQFDTWTFRCAR